uniref:ATP synthase subunit a n=1 Tax=Namalycastis abiuma TaxID=862681 RepID=A0A342K7Y2_9ANNE|nr:ATP synthase F0 subunit 6 [Namalycastis abiuma]AMY15501.1 ATP synthase F0 subunit 6 [Namalycastis abiuma]
MVFTTSTWIIPSNHKWSVYSLMSMMNTQSDRTSGRHLKGFNHTIVTLFTLIIMINAMGLLPYVFSFSSHLLFTLTFGLPLWLSLICSAVMYDTKSWIASLLPGGAPDWLNPFLVVIETISITVRPLTLSFRLAANMSAGHIVLSLIGAYAAAAAITNMPVFILLILTQIMYIIFEMGICLIQAYIFCLLLSLYSDDHPSH